MFWVRAEGMQVPTSEYYDLQMRKGRLHEGCVYVWVRVCTYVCASEHIYLRFSEFCGLLGLNIFPL